MGMPLPPGDLPVPVAIDLEREGDVLLKPFCPPYYKDMEEAVLAFVAYKFAPGMGTFRDGGVATGWKEAATVQADIPNYPAGGYPELPRPDDRRDHRLLRLRPPVLRALPGQHRSVRHRAFSRTLDDRINSAAEETWER